MKKAVLRQLLADRVKPTKVEEKPVKSDKKDIKTDVKKKEEE